MSVNTPSRCVQQYCTRHFDVLLPNRMTAIVTGSAVSDFPQTPRTQSLCLVAGTSLSRCVQLCSTCVVGVSVALLAQVWNLTNCKLKTNHFGHNGFLNCVTVSPDGSLCASGGKVTR